MFCFILSNIYELTLTVQLKLIIIQKNFAKKRIKVCFIVGKILDFFKKTPKRFKLEIIIKYLVHGGSAICVKDCNSPVLCTK